MITQLVYTSSATFDPRSETGQMHVEDILATARTHNARQEITGVLIVGRDWFAQVLEGTPQAVTTLFRNILFDPRHTHVKLVETRIVPTRQFGHWSMGSSNGPMHDTPLSALLQSNGIQEPLEFPFDRIIRHCLQEAELGHLSR